MTEQSDKPSVDGLIARIRKCESMIGRMCAEGQPPLMSIPVDAERDEDIFICDTFSMIRERLAALAGPLEQPQEPQSNKANLAQASGGDDLQTALLAIAEDERLLEVGRKAIEDTLIEWRDERLSELTRRNGLVICEKNGDASSLIRFGPETALRIGLRAIAACEASAGSARSDKPAASSAPESSLSVPKERE